MKFYLLLSKRNLIIITFLFIIAILIWGWVGSFGGAEKNGSTNALRVNYIKHLGYSVDDNSVTCKNITIPQKFNDVYTNYNKLQKKAGFDLSRYRGRSADIYTYPLLSEGGRELHLIVQNGVIIGGDISETAFGGEMLPLTKNKIR